MPEGDTVWRTAHELHRALSGVTLVRAELRVPELATTELTGCLVREVVPRGKHLLARLDNDRTLHSHLGMDGAWRVRAVGQRPAGGPAHELRAILGTRTRTAYGYRLRRLELLPTAWEDRAVGHLGPDLLSTCFDAHEATRRLCSDPSRALGEALLDQRNVAGIGNVYRSELCFLARLRPDAAVGDLADPASLLALARRLLASNRNQLARSTTGERQRGRMLWVYGRAHRPCLRCGTPIQTGQLGPAPERRVAYWCPRCQPKS
ncbi:DNA-formamidopyrimidine glycosylase family protein [Streptomyces oceani]|uniref:DNA-(apurinic or apyrimidinic site) lyase n=1 Tax=Streptomyces oceani TaxID=1075402 RepID=A0A1E7KL48_9ACTN|nr:DNA-formamidopyrimidine glycosylase family protein [Streptomyces oceani]OEV04675.1 DNA glycosylase [Streptomyces oceani]